MSFQVLPNENGKIQILSCSDSENGDEIRLQKHHIFAEWLVSQQEDMDRGWDISFYSKSKEIFELHAPNDRRIVTGILNDLVDSDEYGPGACDSTKQQGYTLFIKSLLPERICMNAAFSINVCAATKARAIRQALNCIPVYFPSAIDTNITRSRFMAGKLNGVIEIDQNARLPPDPNPFPPSVRHWYIVTFERLLT